MSNRAGADAVEHGGRPAVDHDTSVAAGPFELIMQTALELRFDLDEAHTVVRVTPNVEQILGHDPSALVGSSIWSLFDSEDRHVCADALVAAGGDPPAVEAAVRWWHRSAGVVPLLVTIAPDNRRSSAGGHVLTARHPSFPDIAAALRDGDGDRLRETARTATIVVFEADPQGRCSWINEAWSRLTGQDQERSSGTGWTDVVVAQHRSAFRAATSESAQLGDGRPERIRIRAADGSLRWIILAARPRLDDTGAVRGFVGVMADTGVERRSGELDRADLAAPSSLSIAPTSDVLTAPDTEPASAATSGAAPRGGDEIPPCPTLGAVLVVDDDPLVLAVIVASLTAGGFEVVAAASGAEALERLSESIPDVIVSDVTMPGLSGFDLITKIRAQSELRSVPLLFVTTRATQDDIVTGLGLGADDYLLKPFGPAELVARVAAKVRRPTVPADLLPVDRPSGALTKDAFLRVLKRERERRLTEGVVAHLRLPELGSVRNRLGARAEREADRKVVSLVLGRLGPGDVIARDPSGGWLLFFGRDVSSAERCLVDLARAVNDADVEAAGTLLRFTPAVGFVSAAADVEADELIDRARLASDAASLHLDLLPVVYSDELAALVTDRRRRTRRARVATSLRTPFQILVTLIVGMLLPYLAYGAAARLGIDLAGVMYFVVVVALLATGMLIWIEGLLALRRIDPPDDPGLVYPPATAIIAAYLPNEASTILETVHSFLAVDYPAPMQVILAYNSPTSHPIEESFAELARANAGFVPFRVEESTSKAQNVNAALALVAGEFVGVFDADHHPDAGSFRRAWRWLAAGADVVQGHPVVRNGDVSWVSRLVAVEFEAIYSVSHPGRARLHGFGIFGGSNGFWRTSLLRSIRMRGRMLTEDIDSSLRVVEEGGRIVSDPGLVSYELATTTLTQLWNQRMRWAQGWFQVSLRHVGRALRSPKLSVRQKFGFFHLLVWREVYPWLSMQMFPIIAFWTFGEHRKLNWAVPLFVLTSVFTLSVGPAQTYFAYRLAAPEIRAQRRWFWFSLLMTSIFYTEFKNVIARVAQVKEIMGDRQWKVTPRAATKDAQP